MATLLYAKAANLSSCDDMWSQKKPKPHAMHTQQP